MSWYTWLEQGRVTVSRQVLDAVCRVLRMDSAAHRHALEMAGFHDDAPPLHGHEHLRPLIDSWPTTPALLLDQRLDIVGHNTAYRETILDPRAIAPERANLLILLTVELHDAVTNWQHVVRALYGQFRTGTDRLHNDRRVDDIRRTLVADRPDLAHWWQCRSVADFPPTDVTIHGAAMTLSMLKPPGPVGISILARTLE